MFEIFGFFIFIVGITTFLFNWNHFILLLLSTEFMYMGLFFYFFSYYMMLGGLDLILLFLFFFVCEGAFVLGLLVIIYFQGFYDKMLMSNF